MSANRRTMGNNPGQDCPEETTFAEFIEQAKTDRYWRVQGHNRPLTGKTRGLVRFNRAVEVLTETAVTNGRWPQVDCARVEWNQFFGEYQRTGETMTVLWRDLDWITPQLSNDPNGTWIKVKEIK